MMIWMLSGTFLAKTCGPSSNLSITRTLTRTIPTNASVAGTASKSLHQKLCSTEIPAHGTMYPNTSLENCMMIFLGQKSCMTMFRLYSSIGVINFGGPNHIRFTRPHLQKKYASWQFDSLVVKTAYSVRHERHQASY